MKKPINWLLIGVFLVASLLVVCASQAEEAIRASFGIFNHDAKGSTPRLARERIKDFTSSNSQKSPRVILVFSWSH